MSDKTSDEIEKSHVIDPIKIEYKDYILVVKSTVSQNLFREYFIVSSVASVNSSAKRGAYKFNLETKPYDKLWKAKLELFASLLVKDFLHF